MIDKKEFQKMLTKAFARAKRERTKNSKTEL